MAGCPEEATLNGLPTWSGWSRQITDLSEPLSDSAGDWSRMVTEDVCPAAGSDNEEHAKGLELLPKQRVELKLHEGDKTPIFASAASVADLRCAVSEATGTAPEHVHLCEGGSVRGRALLDHELVPTEVTVVGVDRLPGGGVAMGRQQFLRVLLEIKEALSTVSLEEQSHAGSSSSGGPSEALAPPMELAERAAEDVLRCLRLEAEDRGQVFFESFADIDNFYCTSAFSADPTFRSVYATINTLLGKFRGVPCELLGGAGGLIGA